MTTTLKTLTAGEIEGSGAFDELMRTVASMMQNEYSSGRITGSSYAEAYAQSMAATLSTANQFVLQLPLLNQQEILLKEQIKTQEKQTELVQVQIDNGLKDLEIKDAQLSQMAIDLQISGQKLISDTNGAIASDEIPAQAILQTEILGKQSEELSRKVEMLEEQIVNTINQNFSITETRNKSLAEINILRQRYKNDQAQIANIVTGKKTNSDNFGVITETDEAPQVVVDDNNFQGILGAQIRMYGKQGDGFDRSAEQKAAKIFADFFTVVQTTDQVLDYGNWGASSADVRTVLDAMRAGINVVPSDETTNPPPPSP